LPATAIACLLMRGGTSKGPFFRAADLPADVATRDRVLLAVRRPRAGGEADEDSPDPAESGSLGASAGHRVERQLRARLELLQRRELQRLTLAELLYDQQSWEASLGPDGGVMLL
jgi:hypothetical protein